MGLPPDEPDFLAFFWSSAPRGNLSIASGDRGLDLGEVRGLPGRSSGDGKGRTVRDRVAASRQRESCIEKPVRNPLALAAGRW